MNNTFDKIKTIPFILTFLVVAFFIFLYEATIGLLDLVEKTWGDICLEVWFMWNGVDVEDIEVDLEDDDDNEGEKK